MSKSSIVHGLAGMIGGVVSLGITYPLYTAVVRLQSKRKARDHKDPKSGKVDPLANLHGATVHIQDGCPLSVIVWKSDGENLNFYKMQVIVDNAGHSLLWTRWGPKGETGQHESTIYRILDEAVLDFERVFQNQTGNSWKNRHAGIFVKKSGKYYIVHPTKNGEITPSPDGPCLGMFTLLAEIVTEEGWQALYKGLKAALFAVAVQSGVYYYWFAFFRNFHKIKGEPGWNLVAGAEAGVATVLMTNPLWVVNSRQMTSKTNSKNDKNWTETVMAIHKEEGFTGYCSGLVPALALVSNPAILFYSYALFVKSIQGHRKSQKLSDFDIFLIGALAKITSTMATYPIQTVKINLQSTQIGARRYDGVVDCVWTIFRNEGILAFFNGLRTKIVQTSITAALLFVLRTKLVILVSKLIKENS